MSRRKTQAEQDAEFEAECAAEDAIRAKRRECDHYNCKPTEWHWNGQPRVMWCEDCGDTNYIEERCDE
jgi:hypothetical protein